MRAWFAVLLVILVVLAGVYYAAGRRGVEGTVTRTTAWEKPRPVPVLQDLNGTVHSLMGPGLTRGLWWGMRDFNASDPRVAAYIRWLQEAQEPDPGKALNVAWYPRYHYWWFNDRYRWNGSAPGNDSVVRMGVIRLPYGAALVVTAFQNGSDVNVIIHGTIINQTAWLDLLSRVFLFMGESLDGFGPSVIGEILLVNDYYHLVRSSFFNYTNGELKEHVATDWVLWRVELDGHGSTLEVGNATMRLGKIYVLLEMPAYWPSDREFYEEKTAYWRAVEYAYWDIVGEPAFALAINLKYPRDYENYTWGLYYYEVTSLVDRVAMLGVGYLPTNGPPWSAIASRGTAFMARKTGHGICSEQSMATSLFATNALGAVTADILLELENAGWLNHMISLLVYPSSLDSDGVFAVPLDVDGDGENDTVVVMSDTSDLSNSEIIEYGQWNYTLIYPPLSYSGIYMAGPPGGGKDFNYYVQDSYESYHRDSIEKMEYLMREVPMLFYATGVPLATARLPDWLHTPWLNEMLKTPVFNITQKTQESMRELGRIFARKSDDGYALGGPSNDPQQLYRDLRTPYAGIEPHNYVSPATWLKTIQLMLGDMTGPEDLTPPSVALALGKVLPNLPTVYSEETPQMNYTVGNVTVAPVENGSSGGSVQGSGGGSTGSTGSMGGSGSASSNNGNGTGGSSTGTTGNTTTTTTTTSTQSSGEENTVSITLKPTYFNASTPFGTVPWFNEYKGQAIVDGVNITVIGVYNRGEMTVYPTIYVNGSQVFAGQTNPIELGGTGTYAFEWNGGTYTVNVTVPPGPGELGGVINLTPVPLDTNTIYLDNGTALNVTTYNVTHVYTLGNITLYIGGEYSLAEGYIYMEIYGVPPADYNASYTFTAPNGTILHVKADTRHSYGGGLEIEVKYNYLDTTGSLLPQGTLLTITIKPLNITLVIPVKG